VTYKVVGNKSKKEVKEEVSGSIVDSLHDVGMWFAQNAQRPHISNSFDIKITEEDILQDLQSNQD
tara:strand:- start:2288 stop:2482 length:195 start_codon:yes stop_codon:yes gene_type:complete